MNAGYRVREQVALVSKHRVALAVIPERKEDWKLLIDLKRSRRVPTAWGAIKLIRAGRTTAVARDCVSLGYFEPLFRRSALDRVQPLLHDYGEFIEFRFEDESWFWFRCSVTAPLFDAARSECIPSHPEGTVFRYALLEGRAEYPVFRLAGVGGWATFLCDEYVEKFRSMKLIGLDLKSGNANFNVGP